jgi:hypothetical protein
MCEESSLHNLTDMHRKASASFGLRVDRVPVAYHHAKHIDIHHYFICKRVANSEIDLQYVSTKEMLADILMEQLPCEAFEKYRKALGVGE